MLAITRSNRFVKDLKLAIKRGCNIQELDKVVTSLANNEVLDSKYKDHALLGKYSDFRECHIEPDWLLIYRIDDDELTLFLFRAGTHSDLFK